MGRDEQVDRRASHCGRNAAVCQRMPDRARDVAVGHEFPERKPRDQVPNGALKRRSGRGKRKIEAAEPASEIGSHLFGRRSKQRIVRFAIGLPARREGARNDSISVGHDDEIARPRRWKPQADRCRGGR